MNITIDSKQLQKAFNRAPAVVVKEMRGWVKQTSALTEREAKLYLSENVSRGATGLTANSIQSIDSFGGLKSTVKPISKSAYYVHNGRKPGRMPPFDEGSPLSNWARRVGIPAFLVARAIGRKGTKGHPFMDEAYKIVKPKAQRNADVLLSNIVRGI